MVGWMSFLWFVTCVGVIAYGLSNKAVLTLALPRWTSLAVVAAGFSMLMAMFGLMLYAAATDVAWFDNGSVNAERDRGD